MDEKNEEEGFTQHNRKVSASNHDVVVISQTIRINRYTNLRKR